MPSSHLAGRRMGKEGCSWWVGPKYSQLAERDRIRVPTAAGLQSPPRAARALCKRPRPRPRQAPPPPQLGLRLRGRRGQREAAAATSPGAAEPGLSREPSSRHRGAAASPARASAQPARPWQQPPPSPRRIWPLCSPPVSEQPLTSPPSRRCRRGPGSAQVSAAEEARGEGRGERTWGVGRPRPTHPRCGGASWPLRPAADTVRAEPAASQRVSNGTVPRPGWGSRPTAAPRDPATPPPPPSLLGPAAPAASPTPPRDRRPACFLPAADTAATPADIWRASVRPASRSPRPNLKLSWASGVWALLSILLPFPRGVCGGRG